jgi:hypothetical protein
LSVTSLMFIILLWPYLEFIAHQLGRAVCPVAIAR